MGDIAFFSKFSSLVYCVSIKHIMSSVGLVLKAETIKWKDDSSYNKNPLSYYQTFLFSSSFYLCRASPRTLAAAYTHHLSVSPFRTLLAPKPRSTKAAQSAHSHPHASPGPRTPMACGPGLSLSCPGEACLSRIQKDQK